MRSKKPLVESCTILETKPIKHHTRGVKEKKDINDVLKTNTGINVCFWFEYEADSFLVVAMPNSEPQRIVLTTLFLRYGEWILMRCDCGHKAAKLYCPKGEVEFKCRTCWDLRYKSTNYNRHNRVDQLGKELELNRKLSNEMMNIKRPVYNGSPTKRAIRIKKLQHMVSIIRNRHENRNSKRELMRSWKRQRSQYI